MANVRWLVSGWGHISIRLLLSQWYLHLYKKVHKQKHLESFKKNTEHYQNLNNFMDSTALSLSQFVYNSSFPRFCQILIVMTWMTRMNSVVLLVYFLSNFWWAGQEMPHSSEVSLSFLGGASGLTIGSTIIKPRWMTSLKLDKPHQSCHKCSSRCDFRKLSCSQDLLSSSS